jgi:hypothetical protein
MKVSGLAWAFSDNLRNAVIRTNWWYYHATPQGLLRWIVERDWAFHWVAVGNLICQSTLLLACFLTHRPRWRAVLGVLFVSETIGLGVFMGIWNWWWLPLSIFFFDVEALSQSRNVAGQDRKPLPGHGRQLAAGVFITGYLALFCSVAFSSAKGQRFYPFNSYPMYCTVLARKPYSEHLPYDEVVRKFQCRPGNGDSVQILQARSYLMRAPVQSAEQMDYVLTEAERLHPRKNGDVIEVFATPIWIPAYPAPPEAQTIASYCVAMIAADGQRYGAAARVVKVPRSRPVVEVSTLGYAGAAIRLLYYPLPIMNPKLEPQPLPGRFAGEGSSRFEPGPLPPGSYQTLIEVTNPNSGERLTYYGPVWTEPKPALRQKSSPH